MPDSREPRIRSREYGLPYSKGRMAQRLIAAGFEPERAYELSRAIEAGVCSTAADELSVDQLEGIVEDVLARQAPAEMVERYLGWRELQRLDRPLVVLIGGATGTGKSSIATEVAYRLNISRITSTDVVRQVMRAFFARDLMPAIHFSSFEAGEGLKTPMLNPDDEDRALYGFLQQAEQVAVGVNAVLDRALFEGLSMVVEGIHIVPGLVVPEERSDAVVVQALLALEDEDAHRSHFLSRGDDSGGLRATERYLRRLGEIRRIQDYLVGRAERLRVPVVDATDSRQALLAVMDLIRERAVRPRAVR
jgi:2-phosphoglycerate kinase